ncbi:MAG: zinc ribbon domain-containing protein [Lachnospiraceae bacterium]|nr:zinc ribbon domain-containing protein [Lachnospiraceae bacterium]
MICPNCGAEILPGSKFCGNCGAPVENFSQQQTQISPEETIASQPAPAQYTPVQPAQGENVSTQTPDNAIYVNPPGGAQNVNPQFSNNSNPGNPNINNPGVYNQSNDHVKKTGAGVFIVIGIIVILVIAIIIAAYMMYKNSFGSDDVTIDMSENLSSSETDLSGDGGLKESYNYKYADAVFEDNIITITPNGSMNDSTIVYGGKDMGGLCDFIDANVLESGRTLNRDLFYDLLSISLVDPSMYSDEKDIEMSMIYAFATANNFFGMDLDVTECVIDKNTPSDYKYTVKAEGKSDKWIINYKDKTVYFNDGATEYTSDMYNPEYLAIWSVVIEEYFNGGTN